LEKSYKEYLNHITTFIFDVDGVLTDGTVIVNTDGELLRNMNIKDGFALKTAIDRGYNVCIISGGTNEGVRKRLEGLGVKEVFLGAHFKIETLENYFSSKDIKSENVLFMGDDLPDYGLDYLAALRMLFQKSRTFPNMFPIRKVEKGVFGM